ncbi:MAG: hypothetical protein F6K50_24720 [Moorea sp. SIO3I7]|uniref:hypothetical protein n=1 Tax=Moorena sp. SIO3I8 TaxID=2607833 RepID=UPI0013BF62AE|nr:hypothetical protein [Moorena sp. SIO3I8]NEN98597.1 hypothetical protein [Moorena sp. SIO3I7]NEO09600.1 hypothetical protein [Moorena sp. SIO3I8]
MGSVGSVGSGELDRISNCRGNAQHLPAPCSLLPAPYSLFPIPLSNQQLPKKNDVTQKC